MWRKSEARWRKCGCCLLSAIQKSVPPSRIHPNPLTSHFQSKTQCMQTHNETKPNMYEENSLYVQQQFCSKWNRPQGPQPLKRKTKLLVMLVKKTHMPDKYNVSMLYVCDSSHSCMCYWISLNCWSYFFAPIFLLFFSAQPPQALLPPLLRPIPPPRRHNIPPPPRRNTHSHCRPQTFRP